jgi:hypothetical protein
MDGQLLGGLRERFADGQRALAEIFQADETQTA